MLDALLKEKQEKLDRLEHFEAFWKKKEEERKSNQVQVENKYSWHYDENGKVVLDTKNTKEEIQEMGKNIISDMYFDTGYQIARGIMKDEVEKVDRRINKFLKEQKKQKIAENAARQYKMF